MLSRVYTVGCSTVQIAIYQLLALGGNCSPGLKSKSPEMTSF